MAFAYATLQDGMEYYVNGKGYVAYVTIRHPVFAPTGKRVVMGDPMCDVTNRDSLADDFLSDCGGRAVFSVISEDFAQALRKRRYRVNCVGYEPEIQLPAFNFDGNWRDLDIVRRANNEAKRLGITIREADVEVLDQTALNRISMGWLKGKSLGHREIWMFARKPVFRAEPDVRKFVAFSSEGEIIGFAFYDPMYEAGQIVGYSANIVRCDETRFRKVSVALNVAAGLVFREEGKKRLNLCIAPFDKIKQGRYNDDAGVLAFGLLLRRFGGRIYNFGGLSFYKSKYRAMERRVYFASNGLLPINDLYLVFAAAQIAPSYVGVVINLGIGLCEAAIGRIGDVFRSQK